MWSNIQLLDAQKGVVNPFLFDFHAAVFPSLYVAGVDWLQSCPSRNQASSELRWNLHVSVKLRLCLMSLDVTPSLL